MSPGLQALSKIVLNQYMPVKEVTSERYSFSAKFLVYWRL
jgi:hypothetical protein